MKSSDAQLKIRGKISNSELIEYSNYTQTQLVEMLASKEAYRRTIAVKVLSEKYELNDELVRLFLQVLTHEKKLYTKIELCEALSNGNIQTAKIMVKYLGMIGKNQHKKLPTNGFNKTSYPLPRDIIARALAHMNEDVLSVLLIVLKANNKIAIREAIDAIGFICFYKKIHTNSQIINALIQCFKNYEEDDIIRWKLVRAFESFTDSTIIKLLIEIKQNDCQLAIRNEAERSLKTINRLIKNKASLLNE